MIIKRIKAVSSVFFSLLLATALIFTSFADTVRDEDGAKQGEEGPAHQAEKRMLESSSTDEDTEEPGIHSDITTFQKNLILTPAQKEYTITEIEKAVSEIIKPEMSDLEKYYTLAIWANKHVDYDWEFWNGGYDFDYYSHQWDAYGAMKKDEKSVCVGIAIFYSNLCHAADLPCRFVRIRPDYLDHTINYIPDINGNDYYVDVTEDSFLMSGASVSSFEPNIDRAFAGIPEDGCTDGSFDYYDEDDEDYEYDEKWIKSSTIKAFYDVPFADWYREYALHQDTEKEFCSDYKEKGSGTAGVHYASYRDPKYPSDFTADPDIWFLDDFYENPAEIKAKILAGEFDEQLLNVSGVKQNYDCSTTEELEAAVARDISVKYFPTAENGEVAARSAGLTKDTDYTVELSSYDDQTRTAEFTLQGIGDYAGTCQINVKMNSAVVAKEPAPRKKLVYDGSPKELIEPGEAEGGVMQYALGTETEASGEFTTAVPAATDAGNYYVWYKVAGDTGHLSIEPQRMERAVAIDPLRLSIETQDLTIGVGQSVVITPELNVENIPVTFSFESLDNTIASVTENGEVTGIGKGSGTIYIEAVLESPGPNYEMPYDGIVVVDVKAASISGAKVSLSRSAFTYNGKVKKPSVVKINGQKLKAGKDYTVKWSAASPKNVGSYTLTIKGKGNYSGTAKASYRIDPKGTSIKKLKRAKKAIIVKWKKQNAKMAKSRVTGYQIRLATDRKFTKNKKTVTVKGYQKTCKRVSKLKGGKKYYVKIRTYKIVNGKKYYSAWSKVSTVKI